MHIYYITTEHNRTEQNIIITVIVVTYGIVSMC